MKRTSLATALLALAGTTALAQGSGGTQTVVVTATARAQAIDDVQAAVQVIGPEELRAYAGTSVTEALMLAVGVDARANGANSSVSIRGIASGAGTPVLILVDGLQRTAKYGSPNLNLIAVEDVERIEIVRGPMSALYGANATGGVVNVITKPVTGTRHGSGSLRLTLGQTTDDQRQTVAGGATLYAALAGVQNRLSVEHRSRSDFRYDKAAYLADLGDIDETYFSWTGEWAPSAQHRLGWVLEGVRQRDSGPGLLAAAPPTRPQATRFDGFEREDREFAALRYSGMLGPGQLSVDLSRGHSDGSTTRAFPTVEATDYTRTELQARYALSVGPHALIVGVGQTRDELDVSGFLSRAASRRNEHLLAQDEWRLGGGFRLLAGLRHDRFNEFGSVDTPRVALTWQGGPWSLRLGYGEAFRAPSVTEQYSRFARGRLIIEGNPALQPETNKTTELAVGYATRGLSVDLTLFDAKVDNLIQSVGISTTLFRYVNVARARSMGAELQGQAALGGGFSVQFGLDYLEATDADTGARLTGRARSSSRLGLRWVQGPWRADLRARHYADYWGADGNVRGSPPFNSNYGTFDAGVEYRFTPALALALGVDNLTSRRQPLNWSGTGAVMDPPARFAHARLSWQF